MTARGLAVAPPCCEDCGTAWGSLGSAGGTTLCLDCRIERDRDPLTLVEGVNYHQDQDQDQDQDQGEYQVQVFPSKGPPGPGGNSDDGPELRRLMDAHREDRLKPVDVQLGPLPPHAGAVMREIADHLRLLMGLRQAVGDYRPLPYASSMAVGAGLAIDKSTASRALRALVSAGVIDHVGSLPPLRPGLNGTKLYSPPSGGAS